MTIVKRALESFLRASTRVGNSVEYPVYAAEYRVADSGIVVVISPVQSDTIVVVGGGRTLLVTRDTVRVLELMQ